MKSAKPISVLFVCLGNICRSPAAEGAFLALLAMQDLGHRFRVDSCGTGGWHIGELPHRTTREVARANGIELTHRARQFHPERDFQSFDYILTMDESNYNDVMSLAPNSQDRKKVFLYREFERDESGNPLLGERSVPDPYYGGLEGFQEVQSIVTRAAEGFLEFLKETDQLNS